MLLRASGRTSSSTPLRRDFVQQGPQRHPKPGPLRELVRAHDERALDLFLLHRMAASSAPWDVTRDSRIWARGVGVTGRNGPAAVSKAWMRLERLRLVQRDRNRRLVKVTALAEDGSGAPYEYPTRDYFKIPHAYWGDGWYVTLSLAGKATLLIGMSLAPPFVLPADRAPAWYGLSADTAERGLRELQGHGLLAATRRYRTDWGSPTGKTLEVKYALKRPFKRPRRHQPGHLQLVEAAS